jgi:hypothetical protein
MEDREPTSHQKVQEAPYVDLGMFFVNDTPEVVLFDSRASHSFISDAYVETNNLPIALLQCQMIVSSPGGDMPTTQLCPKVNLKIRGGKLCWQPHCLGVKVH